MERARNWIGTPYLHQASSNQNGVDCLGLVRGLWREFYNQEPTEVPSYSADWSEPSGDERLLRAAREYLVPQCIDISRFGDVVLFRMQSGSVAKHLGILATSKDFPTLIHAYTGHGVVETPLTHAWTRRIVAQFSFPERSL